MEQAVKSATKNAAEKKADRVAPCITRSAKKTAIHSVSAAITTVRSAIHGRKVSGARASRPRGSCTMQMSIATPDSRGNRAPAATLAAVHGSAQTQVPPGWEDPERAERLVTRIAAETGFSAGAIVPLCLQSADPDGALAGAVRALAARKERCGRPAPEAALAPLVLVCAGSRFLAQFLAARPRLVDLLACTRFPLRPTPVRASHCTDAGSLARRLRRVKQVEMLRIALRDLSGASVPEVTRDLSRLAASAFDAAVRFHYRRLCGLHGPPAGRTADGPSGFCVLGMGKLGGEELNFSSDADVVYVYDKDGRTSGGLDHFAFY